MPMVRCKPAAGRFPTPREPRANMGDLNILSRPVCWSVIERTGEYAGSRYILKPDELSFRTACPEQECRERSSLRGSRAAALPSDMMLCVISYWVLSGAKWRQIQQLRCCALSRQAVETEIRKIIYPRSPHAAQDRIFLCGGMGLDPQDSPAP